MSHRLYKVRKKGYDCLNFEIKDDVVVNNLINKGDGSVQKVLPIIEDERLKRKIILCIHTQRVLANLKPAEPIQYRPLAF